MGLCHFLPSHDHMLMLSSFLSRRAAGLFSASAPSPSCASSAASRVRFLKRRCSSNITIAMQKKDVSQTTIVENALSPLDEGQVRLKVDKFALTANTVTYGKTGSKFGYFDFYPPVGLDHDTWACVPAIGWATCIESSVPHIPVGGKYFGWYPMAKYCTVSAEANKGGFRDIGEHRRNNAQVYVEHIRSDVDPFRDVSTLAEGIISESEYDDRQAILRGLFLTSFLADEFFVDREYFGAKTVILVSASSKTALGIAQRIFDRNQTTQTLKLIGVTSSANESFVVSTRLYDHVISYNSLKDMPSDEDAVVIDMSGNWKVIESIHDIYKHHIKYSMSIGLSHHDSGFAPKSLVMAGAAPTLFFAPSEVNARLKEWGPLKFHSKSKDALSSFITSSSSWIKISHVYGVDAVQNEWMNAHDGLIPPNVGMMGSMHRQSVKTIP